MTTGTLTLGIDPGGRSTGYAVLLGRELTAAAVLDRATAVDPRHGYAAGAWAEANVEAAVRLLLEARAALELGPSPTYLVAIENVRAPNPHHRRADGNALTNPDGILDTAIVLGQLLRRFPDAVLVEPGGNGARPRGSYPPAIEVPPGGKGQDRLRHARSAFDVALAALALAGRLHGEAWRAARVTEPVLYRAPVTRPTPSVRSHP